MCGRFYPDLQLEAELHWIYMSCGVLADLGRTCLSCELKSFSYVSSLSDETLTRCPVADFVDRPRFAKISFRRKKLSQNNTPQKFTPFSQIKNSACCCVSGQYLSPWKI